MENSLVPLYAVSGLDCCLGSLLVLYNIVALVSFMREDTGGESAGALAKAAWGLGFLGIVMLPCAWFLGPLSMVLASFERRRIYAEAAPLAGATPCRMASVNGGVSLLLWVIAMAGTLAMWLGGSAG